ncbi:hypothetical protein MAR_014740, partial [Mya arenaria]
MLTKSFLKKFRFDNKGFSLYKVSSLDRAEQMQCFVSNIGKVFTMKNFVRRVIRAQLEHLTSLLSMEGEECFIITACIVDGSSHLFGSTKGVEYIQNYFKGVVEEILPYL